MTPWTLLTQPTNGFVVFGVILAGIGMLMPFLYAFCFYLDGLLRAWLPKKHHGAVPNLVLAALLSLVGGALVGIGRAL